MLVLGRRVGEVIVLNGDMQQGSEIVLQIVRVSEGLVHLGFIAPQSINVDRLETYEQKGNVLQTPINRKFKGKKNRGKQPRKVQDGRKDKDMLAP